MGYGGRDGTLFNPWEFPEDLTLRDFVPKDVLEQLHPHWHEYPPLKPFWYFSFGMVYLFGGKWGHYETSTSEHNGFLCKNIDFRDFL